MSGIERGASSTLALDAELPSSEPVSRVEVVVPASQVSKIRWLASSLRATPPAAPIIMGDLVLDLAGYEVIYRGTPIRLTYREFGLLKYLATHPGQVFTREELLAALWDNAEMVSTRTVDIHILRLRNKLGPAARGLLVTVRNVGYKLVVPTRRTNAAEDAPSATPPADAQPRNGAGSVANTQTGLSGLLLV